jgi:hypothetical protein
MDYLPFDRQILYPRRKEDGNLVGVTYDLNSLLDGHFAIIGFGRVRPIGG